MKKLLLALVSVFCFAAANAQFSVGLQGGYLAQKNTTSLDATYSQNSEWLGGLQLGFNVTPTLYVGVHFGLDGSNSEGTIPLDSVAYQGQWRSISDHAFKYSRSGWSVSPVVRFEFLRYGNMHFNIMLQGGVSSKGYTTVTESYTYVGRPNPGEYIELDPVEDSVSNFSWNISLRPTLMYDFSQHLNIELSLDFLSLGYVNSTENHDATFSQDAYTGNVTRFPSHTEKTTLFYAGLNTLVDALHWEMPMLRLGVNYIF